MSDATINDVITYITDLERENLRYKILAEKMTQEPIMLTGSFEAMEDATDSIDKRIYDLGIDALFEEVTVNWNREIEAERDDDGEIETIEYTKWRKEYFNKGVPDNFSKKEVLELFKSRFNKIYEDEKQSAIDRLLKDEAEAKS